jgi:hypothetical protein
VVTRSDSASASSGIVASDAPSRLYAVTERRTARAFAATRRARSTTYLDLSSVAHTMTTCRRVCGLCARPFVIVIPPGTEEPERDKLCSECV